MTNDNWRPIAITVLLVFLVIFMFVIGVLWGDAYPRLHRCPEDSVLVGAGEYYDGYWAEYECGPALDDLP